MNKEIFANLLKNKNNKYIIIILIIGVMFMLFSTGDKKDTEKKPQDTDVQMDMYQEEKRLETIVSDIKGAGSVSVMITYYESVEKDLAYEMKTSQTSKDNSGVQSENIDKQAVLASGSPMVVKEVYPEVKGVVVTAEGAGNPTVKNNIKEAVQSALNVAAHKVCVFEKERK